MAKNVVRLRKSGGLLAVDDLDERVHEILDRALSYTRVVQLRGVAAKRARSNIKTVPISCYTVKPARDGFPARLFTGSGFLWRVARVLRENGYKPMIRDDKPFDAEIFDPHWDALRGVEWRYKQRFCVSQMLKYPYGRIDCPPGYGKSYLIGAMCRLWPRAQIVVSTHAIDVLNQLHDDLSKYIPRVGLISGKSKREGDGIYVVSGKSLHRVTWPVDALFVDEVHEWATDDYLERLGDKVFHTARRYAFSASQEDRMDGAHFELEGVFGQIIARVPYQDAVKHGCVVPIQIWWRDVILTRDPAEGVRDPVERDRWGLWTNLARNRLVAKDAKLFGDDEQVLVAVETIEHAMNLKKLLPEFTLCHSESGLTDRDRDRYIQEGCITAGEPRITVDRRYKLKKAFETGRLKKVIANSVWKRGVDFKQLSVLIRADGKGSAISDTQIPGRTSRICHEVGKEFSVVIDYRDQFNEGLERRAAGRAKNYGSKGWKQLYPKKKNGRDRQRNLFHGETGANT